MYRVGDLVRLSASYPNRMLLSTKYSEKVIEWTSSQVGIIVSFEDEYVNVFIPSGIGCCCIEEIQDC